MTPTAREKGLLTSEVGDELVIYDQDRDRAHSLDRDAAFLWRHCDGHTGVPQLAELLHQSTGLPRDEGRVWYVLHRLKKARLLEADPDTSLDAISVSRREALQALRRLTAAATLPVILSITAPTPADAASTRQCIAEGDTCGFFIQGVPVLDKLPCCSGFTCIRRRIGDADMVCRENGAIPA